MSDISEKLMHDLLLRKPTDKFHRITADDYVSLEARIEKLEKMVDLLMKERGGINITEL